MKIGFHLRTAFLLVCLIAPQVVQAGGDLGKDPYETGERYFAKKDYRIALKHYQKALKRNNVLAHYRLGLIYEAQGRDRDALKHYRQFVDLSQPDAQRSDTVQRMNTIAERLKKGTALSTELLEQGKSLFAKGKFREAEKVLLRAVAKDASSPEVHFYLGEVYMGLEEFKKAKAAYNRAQQYY